MVSKQGLKILKDGLQNVEAQIAPLAAQAAQLRDEIAEVEAELKRRQEAEVAAAMAWIEGFDPEADMAAMTPEQRKAYKAGLRDLAKELD